MPDTFTALAAVSIGLVAVVTDIRTRRIPNALTFGAAALALAAHGLSAGWSGLAVAGGGLLVGLVLFFPLFALGGMGAGDVKLLAALGAWLGPVDAFWVAIYASLAGGVMAIVVAFRHQYLGAAFRNVYGLLTHWYLVGPRPLPAVTLERSTGPRLAYAIPIFVGTMVTLWV